MTHYPRRSIGQAVPTSLLLLIELVRALRDALGRGGLSRSSTKTSSSLILQLARLKLRFWSKAWTRLLAHLPRISSYFMTLVMLTMLILVK